MATRTIRDAFDELLRRSVPTASERAAATRHRTSVQAALEPLGTYGLRETGSFHHGTGVRGHSDIDVLISLKGDQPPSSDTALNRVRSTLTASFPRTTVRISRPAVVVEFAAGAERWEIIPGYIRRVVDDTPVYAIPGPRGGWIESAPQAHLRYVNEQDDSPKGGAKKLSRLIKAYKYANQPKFKVSSFYLEMRAARYMGDETSFISSLDFSRLLGRLEASDMSAMNDPTGVTGRFHATSTENYRTEALARLRADAQRTRDALEFESRGRIAEAFEKMDMVFVGTFPSRFY